jgi:hypothetical protein
MSCRIRPNIELEQGAIGGQPSRSIEEANLSVEQGKHLRVGVGWKLVALGLFPYKNTLFTPMMD